MLYKAKVAVCSDIHTKHTTQSERHVEFLNVKPWWYVKKPLGVKRLIWITAVHQMASIPVISHVIELRRFGLVSKFCT